MWRQFTASLVLIGTGSLFTNSFYRPSQIHCDVRHSAKDAGTPAGDTTGRSGGTKRSVFGRLSPDPHRLHADADPDRRAGQPLPRGRRGGPADVQRGGPGVLYDLQAARRPVHPAVGPAGAARRLRRPARGGVYRGEAIILISNNILSRFENIDIAMYNIFS